MKTYYPYAMLLLAGTLALTSCSDDNDANPTLSQPSAFEIVSSTVGAQTVVLETSKSIGLTWTQPGNFTNSNAPVVPTYTIDVSPTGSFTTAYNADADDNSAADYVTLAQTYTATKGTIDPTSLNQSLMNMLGWESEDDVPALMTLTLRVKAALRDASFRDHQPIYSSNTITLNTSPYYMVAADPEIWWLIGGDIGDGSWGTTIGQSVLPMQSIEDADYDKKTGQGPIQWTGWLAGNGLKLRGALDDGWAAQWGQASGFGDFVKNDGGSGNITVPSAGLYTVTLNTASNKLTVEEYEGTAKVYDGMAISGSFNNWGDTPMNPTHTYAGAENHDWWLRYDFAAGDEVKVKQLGSWDFNCGGSLVNYADGMYVYGVGNGANLAIPEDATYLILFNDITGFIRFIKQ